MSYWSRWRAAHPEYRERQNRLRRERRARDGRGDRSAEYARQRERRAEQRLIANGDNGHVVDEHPLLTRARDIASRYARPDRRSLLHRPTFEDAVSEAVLAILTGADPEEAAQRVIREDRGWLLRTAPLLDELLSISAASGGTSRRSMGRAAGAPSSPAVSSR